LSLGPERIEVGDIVILSVDVGADKSAAKFEIDNGVLQDFRRPPRILQRYRRHADETIGPRLGQLIDAVVVEIAPGLALAAVQSIAQAVGVGFEGCQTDLALIHYFDMFFDIEDRRLQTVRFATGERQRPTAFVLGNFDA
jgi:hypothetical protein